VVYPRRGFIDARDASASRAIPALSFPNQLAGLEKTTPDVSDEGVSRRVNLKICLGTL
jgi:hypothetical protein